MLFACAQLTDSVLNPGFIPFYQKILLGAFAGRCSIVCETMLLWIISLCVCIDWCVFVYVSSGFCGGIVGSPFDVVNIRYLLVFAYEARLLSLRNHHSCRMQNDVKLPAEQRRR